MLSRYNGRNIRRVASATLIAAVVSALGMALSATTNVRALSKPTEDDAQIAKSLATMLRAGRAVISKYQQRINDPNVGDKGIDAKMVLSEAGKNYQDVMGVDAASIDPETRHGKLVRMQMESIAEVMDTHQETINRQGVGFKGFIPAVFGRLVNEAFGRRAVGIAEMKVTAPPQLIRNAKVRPDEWELEVIRTRLMTPSWPKDQPFSAITDQHGAPAHRTLMPEYYAASCLTCHGSPKGEIDITGYPKEGASEGDLGGIISITLLQ